MTMIVTVTNKSTNSNKLNVVSANIGYILDPGQSQDVTVYEGHSFTLAEGEPCGGLPSGPDNS